MRRTGWNRSLRRLASARRYPGAQLGASLGLLAAITTALLHRADRGLSRSLPLTQKLRPEVAEVTR